VFPGTEEGLFRDRGHPARKRAGGEQLPMLSIYFLASRSFAVGTPAAPENPLSVYCSCIVPDPECSLLVPFHNKFLLLGRSLEPPIPFNNAKLVS